MPRLLIRVEPVCPPVAKLAHAKGLVHMMITIGRDGTVQEPRVVSGWPLFYNAAFDAVRQWRYEPALLNGEPVEVQMAVAVEFKSD